MIFYIFRWIRMFHYKNTSVSVMGQVMYAVITLSGILSVRSVGVYHYFIENTDLTNKVLEYNLTENTHPSSFFDCAAKCDLCCSCFGFNTLTSNCRVFKTCYKDGIIGHEEGWTYYLKNEFAKPANCHDLFERGHATSGFFTIYPWDECDSNFRSVDVFCDMDTADGGWTLLQRRISGSVDFNRSWSEYKTGFGNIKENFWIGNDVIHQLTRTENVTLFVAITLASGETKYQVYQHFSVADVSDKFRLFLQGPTNGSLGDSMVNTESTGKLNRNLPGMLFTTYDQDNDGKTNGNCGLLYGGGWWFNGCYVGYLNGPWRSFTWSWPWYPTVTSGGDIRRTIMMIRQN